MSSALVFIVVLGVLVIVHEFGHFIAAKAVGVRVEKFSVGFGKVIFGRKFGETEFCVSVLPLGGFVKLSGESPDEATGKPWEFNSKNLWEKFVVVFAGPLMNALLAFLIFSFVYTIGYPTPTSKIGKVMDDTPAKAAGILEGDRVKAINGQGIVYFEDLVREVRKSSGPVIFSVERAGEMIQIPMTPKVMEAPNLFGKKTKVYLVGVRPSEETINVKHPLFRSLVLAVKNIWNMTILIFTLLWLLISGGLSFKEAAVGGPIGIFFMTHQASQLGFIYLLNFMGSLSVSLFAFNLLPVPMLDGGHVLFILIEKLKGSPLKDSIKEKMTMGGMAFLVVLMVFATFQDIRRYSVFENISKYVQKII